MSYDVLRTASIGSNRQKIFIGILSLIFSVVSLFFLTAGKFSFMVVFATLPLIILSLFHFHKYSMYFFIGSMFLARYFYWPLRIQLAEFVIIIVFFYYLINKDSGFYNNFSVPKSVKLSAALLIFAVFISSVLSPHASAFSVYLSFLFLLFMISSYLTFKSVINSESVFSFLDSFSIFTVISCIIILIQIFLGKHLRSVGLAGYAIMDFTAMASLILIIGGFLLGKIDTKKSFLIFIVLIGLITTQSRFAWLGFMLSMIYGVTVCSLNLENAYKFLRNKILLLIVLVLILSTIIFATGLGSVITSRLDTINVSVLQAEEGQDVLATTNSLDTRILIWLVAYNTFLKNPVTGVGYQMFSEVSENYNIIPDLLYEDIVKDLDAHTTYLNFLVDTGLIGLSAFLIYLIIIFRISYRSIKLSRNDFEKKVSIILNVLVFFIMVHSIYSGAFTFGQNAFSMHFVNGLTVANYVNLKRNS